MPKYELSISTKYVPDWTVTDAVREFFQNAIDQANAQADNDMRFAYDPESCTLRIGNRRSVLEAKSLLLGYTTKAENRDTIGQFGEGYKIASLVLVRSGKKVTFYNFGRRELWRPRLSRSQKYGETILVFDVKNMEWYEEPEYFLDIVVEGITPEEYEEIVRSNLHLQKVYEDPDKFVQTAYGKILLSPEHASRVYVNGLYVCTNPELSYGYDFLPEHLKLGRDRSLVADFDLFWLTSKTWQDSGLVDEVLSLVGQDAADVKYIPQVSFANFENHVQICETAYSEFVKKFGPNAVPVVNNEEALVAEAAGLKPVVVTEVHKKLIESAPDFVPPRLEQVPFEVLISDFLRKNAARLSDESLKKLFVIAPKQVNEVLAERGESPIELSEAEVLKIVEDIHAKVLS